MHRLKGKKNAFTLAETIIVCTIFAIMVVWIILWINRGFLFMNNTKVLVRATNFAREWVEIVYNIRDTNRRKYSGEKDEHRTFAWTGSFQLNSWMYVIREYREDGEDSYFYAEYLTWNSSNLYDLDWFFDDDNKSYREKSKITFPWIYSYHSWWEMLTWNLEDLLGWKDVEFYRVLRVDGIYCKGDSNPSPNQLVDSSHCYKSSDPKEMRFCVKVFYEYNWWHHSSELCSIMTNFMK